MKCIGDYLIKSNLFLKRNVSFQFPMIRLQSTTSIENEAPSTIEVENDQEEPVLQKKIQTNKSRLLPQHRNMLMDKTPYEEPQSWIHTTEKYQRKMFGKYGMDSKVDPRICFYTKAQKELRDEYERIAYPHTIQEMMKINENEKEAKRLALQKREDDVAKKISKLEQWKAELEEKIAKKEAEALAAKQRKERLVEEVRRHFGFTVDPREERFKELLEQKEKEDRKKQKEAKRKAKEEKLMQKLIEKTTNKPPSKTEEKTAE